MLIVTQDMAIDALFGQANLDAQDTTLAAQHIGRAIRCYRAANRLWLLARRVHGEHGGVVYIKAGIGRAFPADAVCLALEQATIPSPVVSGLIEAPEGLLDAVGYTYGPGDALTIVRRVLMRTLLLWGANDLTTAGKLLDSALVKANPDVIARGTFRVSSSLEGICEAVSMSHRQMRRLRSASPTIAYGDDTFSFATLEESTRIALSAVVLSATTGALTGEI